MNEYDITIDAEGGPVLIEFASNGPRADWRLLLAKDGDWKRAWEGRTDDGTADEVYLSAADLGGETLLGWMVLYYGPKRPMKYRLRLRISQDGQELHEEIEFNGKTKRRKISEVSGQIEVNSALESGGS